MKRIISAITLMLILAVPAFSLSGAEYLRMKKANADFAKADRQLTQVWNKLKSRMSRSDFRILQDEQREWIDWMRDNEAESYMDSGYSRIEAYTMATYDRVRYIQQRARDIERYGE